jgi:hypothetical protein
MAASPAHARRADPAPLQPAPPEAAKPVAKPPAPVAGPPPAYLKSTTPKPPPPANDAGAPGKTAAATNPATAKANAAPGGTQAADGKAAPAGKAGPAAGGARAAAPQATSDARGSAPATEFVLAELAGHTLHRERLRLPEAAASFDAPRALEVRPTTPPSDSEAKNPEIARAPAAFAEAVAAAQRLHSQLIDDAANAASEARAAAGRRAADMQDHLDTARNQLTASLDTAQGRLASAAQTALGIIDARAAEARLRINASASTAIVRLHKAATDLHTAFDKPKQRAGDIESDARNRADDIVFDGESAAASLNALAAYPEAADLTGKPMEVAKGETIVAGMPPRATIRADYFTAQAGIEETFLTGPLDRFHGQMARATKDFDQMLAKAEQLGPLAVEQTRTAALKQTEATVKQLTQAMEHARDATAATINKQYNAGRQQLIDDAETQAKGDQAAAEARGARDVNQFVTLARGQGGAVKSLVAGFTGERKRPPVDFATVVTRSATGLTQRLGEQADQQRPRLAAVAAEGREGLARDADAAEARRLANADANAEALKRIAADVGDALVPQAEDGCAGLKQLAGPIAAALKEYLPPLEATGQKKIAAMNDAIDKARLSLNGAFSGNGGAGGGDGGDTADTDTPAAVPGATPGAPPGGGAQTQTVTRPDLPPDAFDTAAKAVDTDVLGDELIAKFIAAAKTVVLNDILHRVDGLKTELGHWRSDVDKVQDLLRGLTKKRGDAVRSEYPGDLQARLDDKLSKWFSSGATNRANKRQARAALEGRTGDAALEEMRAAKGWWNDDARVEKAFRALTPAQLGAMARTADGQQRLDQIAGMLHGVDRQVFDLLRDAEAHPENIAKANALRLQAGIDSARNMHGESGGDATYKAFAEAAHAAGQDRLSGDTTLDAGIRVNDELGAKLYTKRSGEVWQATLAQFDSVVGNTKPNPDWTDKDGKPLPGSGAYGYAIANRTYTRTVGSKEFRHEETRTDVLSDPQRKSIEALLRFGVDSDEAAGARLNVLRSQGGKPDPKKIDEVMHDPSLDAHIGEQVSEKQQAEREERAKLRYQKIYEAYEKYSRPPGAPERTVEDAKRDFIDWARTAHSGDRDEQKYVTSMLDTPVADPVTAFNYALSGFSVDTDLLKKTFGRMSPAQVDAAVKKYNETHPGGPSLYARLGIFGENNQFVSRLSGDKRNDVEIAAMGVPVTDLDRYQVARMVLKQQKDQAGWFGKHVFARDEWDDVLNAEQKLQKQGGFSAEEYAASFDSRGRFFAENPITHRKNPVGHFNEKGEFVPPVKGETNDFEAAITMASLVASDYKEATDRAANFVSTAIIAVAAIVSTALTFGAAASIWIPVLVTAGAGLLAMGTNALIKGGRYGRDEALHDLAMTVIQAATAGLGAAASAALKGGLPALRLVAGAWKIPQTAVRAAAATEALVAAGEIAEGTALQAAERGATASLGRSLTLGEEFLVGGGSSAFAGGATAAIDMDAWREGRWGAGILHGIGGGFLGGGLGAGAASLGAGAINRFAGGGRALLGLKALAEGERAHPLIGGLTRLSGAASAGFTQSVIEGGYRAAAEGRDVRFGDLVSEGGWAALQNLAQSVGEHTVEEAGEARHGARRPPTVPGEPVVPRTVEEHEPVRPVQPAQTRPAEPPQMRRTESAEARPAGTPTPAQPRAPVEPETAARPGPRRPGEEEAIPARRPAEEAEPHAGSRLTAEEPTAITHTTGSADAVEEHLIHWPDATVITDLHSPQDPNRANLNYHEAIQAQTSMEVGLYRSAVTGDFVVVQGNDLRISAALLESAHRPWILEQHYHPLLGNSRETPRWLRMPSGRGGDFATIEAESRAIGGPRRSRIDYLIGDEYHSTYFGFDPHSTTARYTIDIVAGPGQPAEHHEFASLDAYGAWYAGEFNGGTPHIGEPVRTPPSGAPAPTPAVHESEPVTPPVAGHDDAEPITERMPRVLPEPGTPPAPRPPGAPEVLPIPEQLTVFHGTTKEDLPKILERIIANRGSGASDDFGAAFYVTLERENAQIYASQRSGDITDTTLGAVLEFTLKREALGEIVDVRPGGEHRADWEGFLDRQLIPATPEQIAIMRRNNPDAMITMRDLVDSLGGTRQRGAYFDQFLAEIGKSNAGAVIGDLGGVGTWGFHMQEGGTQIAIRSLAVADHLSTLPERPVEPASGGAGRPPEPPPPPAPPAPEPQPPSDPDLERAFSTWTNFDTEAPRPANDPSPVINPLGIEAQNRSAIGPKVGGRSPLEQERLLAIASLQREALPPGASADKRARALRMAIVNGFATDRAAILAFRDQYPELGAAFVALFHDEASKAVQGRQLAIAAMQLLEANPLRLEQAILAYQAARAPAVGAETAQRNAHTLRQVLNHQGFRDRLADARNLKTDREHAARVLVHEAVVTPADLAAYRAQIGVATTETVAVARSDLPGLHDLPPFQGASPLVRAEAELGEAMPGPIVSPATNELFTRHAEQDIANQVHWAIVNNGIAPKEMYGYSISVFVSQEVCSACKSGTGDLTSPAGVLRQLSAAYPNLVIRVRASGTAEEIVLYRGRRIDPVGAPFP